MAAESSTIHPLPAEVVAQIKSSVAITSLSDVVLGLLGNSLDAGALRVEISVDFGRGGCTVEDDGAGIPPTEFREDGGLGRLHYTSKFHSRTRTHGRNGTFLASLMALSLVIITSHHHLHRPHNTLSVHQTKVISRLMPAPAHQYLLSRNHGTRVTVRDLFGNMPVRVKQRTMNSGEGKDTETAWEDLKRAIVGVLLAEARELNVVVRDAAKDRKFTIRPPGSATVSVSLNSRDFEAVRSRTASCDLSLIRSILAQTSHITPASWDSWVAVSASIPHLSIEGAISSDPAPTKQVQYISFGIRPLSPAGGNNILFDEINRLFAASGFGVLDDESDVDDLEKERRLKDRRYKSEAYTKKQLKGGRKGVDRWPMFSLCFKIKGQGTSQNILCKDETLNDDGYLVSLLDLLGAVTTEFLAQNHFRPRLRQKKGLVESPEPASGSSVDAGGRRLRSQAKSKGTPGHSSQMLLRADGDASTKTKFLITQRPTDPNPGKQKPKKRRLSSPKHDALGSNLKIPGFSHNLSRMSGPSLNLFSRVKSGKKGFIEDSCGAIPRTFRSLEIGKAASGTGSLAAQSSGEDETSSTTENTAQYPGVQGPRESNALNAGDGHRKGSLSGADRVDEILEDQLIPLVPSHTDASPSIPDSESPTDNLIHWVNPTTNRSFFVNSRTGVASLASKTPKRKSHRSSPPGRGTTPSNNFFQPFKRLKPTSRPGSLAKASSRTWIGDLLKDWENPIFKPTEQEIPQVRLLEGTSSEASNILHGHHHGCSQMEVEKAFKESSSALPGKLSKKVLGTAHVIAQVDKKFILVKAAAVYKLGGPRGPSGSEEWLVLIDQHAADERCRIEELLEELCTPLCPDKLSFKSSLGFTSRIATTQLLKPMKFYASPREHRLFKIHAHHFANWGILYDLASPPVAASMIESSGEYSVVVRALPPGIAERCKTDVGLVVELLRAEVWKREECSGVKRTSWKPISVKGDLPLARKIVPDVASAEENDCDWLRMIGDCPQGILDMLNSRSCRSAVMFNDELTIAECQALVSKLARCKFPFQCAHGRPSMIPLVDLSLPAAVAHLRDDEDKSAEFKAFGAGGAYKDGSSKEFVSAFKRWRSDMALSDASTAND